MPAELPREHGTSRGYWQHVKRGEDPAECTLGCLAVYRAEINAARDKDADNARRREARRRRNAGSHHVGACLASGRVVYAERSLPIAAQMRAIHAAHEAGKLASPKDEAAVEAWARNYPESICKLPFDNCDHE